MSARGLLAALAAAVSITGCSNVKVQSEFDPRHDFADLRTYAWMQENPVGADDPRITDPATVRRVRTAVDRALRAKGFEEATSGTPDFFVAWAAAIQGKMSYQTISDYYGYGWGWYGGGFGTTSPRTYTTEWDEGTLYLGIIDPVSNELVWWGSAQGEMDQSGNAGGRSQAEVDEIAAKILASFPPRGREGAGDP